MTGDLPEYYFRVRENGATVFRVDTENRQRRVSGLVARLKTLKWKC